MEALARRAFAQLQLVTSCDFSGLEDAGYGYLCPYYLKMNYCTALEDPLELALTAKCSGSHVNQDNRYSHTL